MNSYIMDQNHSIFIEEMRRKQEKQRACVHEGNKKSNYIEAVLGVTVQIPHRGQLDMCSRY